ncbi:MULTISPECIES: hypothetical protein [Nocardia]|uniref:Uncharacterized protein n=1 Tax=Nocardia sputorum TaxID=2984338 RepID=A0ABN6U0Q8_9NOCA|nr:hypothetical protein [Nocardia sputorum]BDT98821.1 hypothetical protein IFM12276_18500 [Nocardia sputorum]
MTNSELLVSAAWTALATLDYADVTVGPFLAADDWVAFGVHSEDGSFTVSVSDDVPLPPAA